MEFKFKDLKYSVGSSNGFWYDITYGGYINPEEILEDPEQIKKVLDAVEILKELESQGFEKGIFNEF